MDGHSETASMIAVEVKENKDGMLTGVTTVFRLKLGSEVTDFYSRLVAHVDVSSCLTSQFSQQLSLLRFVILFTPTLKVANVIN